MTGVDMIEVDGRNRSQRASRALRNLDSGKAHRSDGQQLNTRWLSLLMEPAGMTDGERP